ncbi:hypothetical protein OE88DRAFT_1648692 [Heliocybe sulcata]|uniref:Uncharacterized protein n=1 Tax=Heliocybe sulcata TaxID=5364 RepID=A0A5C3MLM1_9AGAM|nr:hypothetical protein OE88DRAFT_1648692 [Heliocybe sulcata]
MPCNAVARFSKSSYQRHIPPLEVNANGNWTMLPAQAHREIVPRIEPRPRTPKSTNTVIVWFYIASPLNAESRARVYSLGGIPSPPPQLVFSMASTRQEPYEVTVHSDPADDISLSDLPVGAALLGDEYVSISTASESVASHDPPGLGRTIGSAVSYLGHRLESSMNFGPPEHRRHRLTLMFDNAQYAQRFSQPTGIRCGGQCFEIRPCSVSTASNIPGIGRTLDQLVSILSRQISHMFSLAGNCLGLGPSGVMRRRFGNMGEGLYCICCGYGGLDLHPVLGGSPSEGLFSTDMLRWIYSAVCASCFPAYVEGLSKDGRLCRQLVKSLKRNNITSVQQALTYIATFMSLHPNFHVTFAELGLSLTLDDLHRRFARYRNSDFLLGRVHRMLQFVNEDKVVCRAAQIHETRAQLLTGFETTTCPECLSKLTGGFISVYTQLFPLTIDMNVGSLAAMHVMLAITRLPHNVITELSSTTFCLCTGPAVMQELAAMRCFADGLVHVARSSEETGQERTAVNPEIFLLVQWSCDLVLSPYFQWYAIYRRKHWGKHREVELMLRRGCIRGLCTEVREILPRCGFCGEILSKLQEAVHNFQQIMLKRVLMAAEYQAFDHLLRDISEFPPPHITEMQSARVAEFLDNVGTLTPPVSPSRVHYTLHVRYFRAGEAGLTFARGDNDEGLQRSEEAHFGEILIELCEIPCDHLLIHSNDGDNADRIRRVLSKAVVCIVKSYYCYQSTSNVPVWRDAESPIFWLPLSDYEPLNPALSPIFADLERKQCILSTADGRYFTVDKIALDENVALLQDLNFDFHLLGLCSMQAEKTMYKYHRRYLDILDYIDEQPVAVHARRKHIPCGVAANSPRPDNVVLIPCKKYKSANARLL